MYIVSCTGDEICVNNAYTRIVDAGRIVLLCSLPSETLSLCDSSKLSHSVGSSLKIRGNIRISRTLYIY